MNPSFYASFANVFFRKPDGFRVAVEAVCFKGGISPEWQPIASARAFAQTDAGIQSQRSAAKWRCKPGAMCMGFGTLPQSAAYRYRRTVTDDTILLDSCQVNNASGKGFLDGGSVGVSPITSLMQSNTRAV